MSDVDLGLVLRHDAASLQGARQCLERYGDRLRLADQAVKLPKCRFDRDWSLGFGVLMPEFAQMKSAARLLALRGSVAAASGDAKGAVTDIDRVFVIASHARQEPTAIAQLVVEGLSGSG